MTGLQPAELNKKSEVITSDFLLSTLVIHSIIF